MDLNTSETPALANMTADDLDEISGEAWEENNPTDLVLISQLLVPPLPLHPGVTGPGISISSSEPTTGQREHTLEHHSYENLYSTDVFDF
jgi:hypothetical protein